MASYNYNPANVKKPGRDRMRFELGDVMVEGGSDTAALTDEEIGAALDAYPGAWKRAKLFLIESLYRRFSYEVNTKTGPLTLELQKRAELWRKAYEDLKAELEAGSAPPDSALESLRKPMYFHTGMQENPRAFYEGGGGR